MQNFTKQFFFISIILLFISNISISQAAFDEKEKHIVDLDEVLQTDAEKDRLIKMQRLLKAYRWLGKYNGVAIIAKDGKPIYNEKGKVMKGPNYFLPDFSKLFKKLLFFFLFYLLQNFCNFR